MEPSNRTARFAGWWYLACALVAPFAMIYVPAKLFVPTDPAATIRNVLASESLFRWSILASMISTAAFMLAVLMLYKLLAPVSRALGLAMAGLALVSLPVSLLDNAVSLAILNVLHGVKTLAGIDALQRQPLALLLLGLGGPMIAVSELFWGLWLLPLGALIIRSGFLPRWLGAVLLINGVAYVGISFAAVVAPAYLAMMNRLGTIPEMGELVLILWLLIRGIRVPGAVGGTVAAPA